MYLEKNIMWDWISAFLHRDSNEYLHLLRINSFQLVNETEWMLHSLCWWAWLIVEGQLKYILQLGKGGTNANWSAGDKHH